MPICEWIAILWKWIVDNITDLLMIVITAIYVIATIRILKSNQAAAEAAQKSAVAAQKSVEVAQDSVKATQESVQVAKDSVKVAQDSVRVAQEANDESKKQFEINLRLQQNNLALQQSNLELQQRNLDLQDNNLELQKQHNIDAVRPAVSIDFEKQDGFVRLGGKITITNHGLGPAIIQQLTFIKNGVEYVNVSGYCTLFDLICRRIDEEDEDETVKNVLQYCYTKEFRNNADNNDFLAVGEKLKLLEFDAKNKLLAESVGKIFYGIEMQIKYTDIYNSQSWVAVSQLSYFKPCWID